MISMTRRQELDKAIFLYFQADQTSAERDNVLKLLKETKVPVKKLDEILANHFYLAPQNLVRAQLFLALLCYLLTLAIMVVRVGSDFVTLMLALVIGTIAALPYLFNYFLLSKLKSFSRFKFFAQLGLLYSFFSAFVFIIITLELKLTGVILIPILLLALYWNELAKLRTLIKELNLPE